jgi:glycosyltransferase involved in cell wall biosynthesis
VRSPAASIIIPVLDQVGAWLAQCVRSALRQTVDCEVIVVHSPRTGAPNLSTLTGLSRAHAGLVVVQEPPGGGFARAINFGVLRARSDRIGLLLSDDWLELRTVERCLAHVADIVSTDHTEYLEDGVTKSPVASRGRRADAFERLATLEQKARYLKHFFLFRKAKLIEVGGLDESLGDFPGIDDFDLIWTLLEHGATVAVIEESLYNYRDHHGERLTLRDADQAIRTMGKILDKHGLAGGEKQRVLALHAPWYGRPVHVVHAEMAGQRFENA